MIEDEVGIDPALVVVAETEANGLSCQAADAALLVLAIAVDGPLERAVQPGRHGRQAT